MTSSLKISKLLICKCKNVLVDKTNLIVLGYEQYFYFNKKSVFLRKSAFLNRFPSQFHNIIFF